MNDGKTQAHGVAIVVDGRFGARLPALACGVHVWLLDTPANREAANEVWQSRESAPSIEEGVTTFRADSNAKPDQVVSSMLGTIDLHHGRYSHSPPWSFVEVYGTTITPALTAVLASFGFTNVATLSDDGFKAWRSGGEAA
jgi:hypothetical protein